MSTQKDLIYHDNMIKNNILYNTVNMSVDCSGTKFSIVKNTAIDKYYNPEYLMDLTQGLNNVDLKTPIETCTRIKKPFINDIQKIKSKNPDEYYLSDDNIYLMDPCDFYDGINPLTNKVCTNNVIESMQNFKMTRSDKGYLMAFTLLIVGILFNANYKITHKK